MIVSQIGYLKLNDVLKLKNEGNLFSIYKTNKNTLVLVMNTESNCISLNYPKKDRLPWKLIEGKKITYGVKIYTSTEIKNINTIGWNNNEQIMAYEQYSCV